RIAVGVLQLPRNLGHAAEHAHTTPEAAGADAVPDVAGRELAHVHDLAPVTDQLVVLLLLDAAEQGVALTQGDGRLQQEAVRRVPGITSVTPPGEGGLPVALGERTVEGRRRGGAVDVALRLELLGAVEMAPADLERPVRC